MDDNERTMDLTEEMQDAQPESHPYLDDEATVIDSEPAVSMGTPAYSWQNISSSSAPDHKEAAAASVIPQEEHAASVIPQEEHAAPVIPQEAAAAPVIPQEEHAAPVIPQEEHAASVTARDTLDNLAGTAPQNEPTTIVGARADDYLDDYQEYIRRKDAETTAEDEYRRIREEAERLEARYAGSADANPSYDLTVPEADSISTAGGSSAASGSSAEGWSGNAGPGNTDPGAYTSAAESSAPAEVYKRPGRTQGGSHAASPRSTPDKEPRYVTRKALAICMAITMIVSTLLGALVGGAFSRSSGGTDDRAARNDSELSSLSLSDGTGSAMTVSEIINQNADSVVEILVSGSAQNFFGQMQPVEGAGSGVIVREDGYIVTNYHVIQGANKVQVTLHNGETYPAAIVGGDNDKDIAIIKINASGLKAALIGDSSTVSVGDTAVAIGNPLGQLGGTATAGIISALDRNLEIEGRTMTLMQTDAAINGGNSGGGLFNSKGELIGIVDAKSSGVGIEGLAFAIPINSVVETIDDIIENGTVTTRPVVGVTIMDVTEETAQYYQLESAGVYISQVTGENAQKAGFQSEDRIISIDGETIESSQQFIAAVKKHKAGDTVSIVVSRGGQEIEIRTVLEEYTSAE